MLRIPTGRRQTSWPHGRGRRFNAGTTVASGQGRTWTRASELQVQHPNRSTTPPPLKHLNNVIISLGYNRRPPARPLNNMGPLQLVSHVYKKRHAGEHETHWVNTSIDLSRSVKHFLPSLGNCSQAETQVSCVRLARKSHCLKKRIWKGEESIGGEKGRRGR